MHGGSLVNVLSIGSVCVVGSGSVQFNCHGSGVGELWTGRGGGGAGSVMISFIH